MPNLMLPVDPAERKDIPLASGLLDYFPLALAEVARISKIGNDQHNPGQPLHWARGKSMDNADCIARHLVDRGTIDPSDGQRHSGKMAWRALALLELELEEDRDAGLPRGAWRGDDDPNTPNKANAAFVNDLGEVIVNVGGTGAANGGVSAVDHYNVKLPLRVGSSRGRF